MTPADAAALARLGLKSRRLVDILIRILSGRGTAEDALAVPPRESGESVLHWTLRCQQPGRDVTSDLLHAHQTLVERQLADAARGNVHALPLGDPDYPPCLAAIANPPPLLWVRGQTQALSAPGIALVGSRAATPYGLAMARQLALDLSAAGLVIVSGLARGVDAAAHGAATSAGGTTVGVLGCGIDRIYPAEHRDLARQMQGRGAVVSEFPADVPPLPHHFPLRNRIISGLSLAVVVVEAPEKSGALITASAAADHGREVFVVPGPVTGGRNRGGHLLLRDGARVVESADDILQDLAGCTLPVAAGSTSVRTPPPPLAHLGQLPETADFTIDDVAALTGAPAQLVLSRLLDLELAGRIQRVGGGRFVRVLT